MDCISSPSQLLTSDPPLHDDWVINGDSFVVLPSSIYSDDLEAIHLVHEENVARKNKTGVVIQHRAWAVADVFRSDIDYCPDTPAGLRNKLSISSSSPSLQPSLKMPSIISSPVAYPPSSSPPVLKEIGSNRTAKSRPLGAFLDDESGDEGSYNAKEHNPKRRMLRKVASPKEYAALSTGHVPDETQETNVGSTTSQPFHQSLTNVGEKDGRLRDSSCLDRDILAGTFHALRSASQTEAVKPSLPSFLNKLSGQREIRTCSGKSTHVTARLQTKSLSYEEMVAARSTAKVGRARKSYYGIDVQQLVEEVSNNNVEEQSRNSKTKDAPIAIASVENPGLKKPRRTAMWTEKYRAKRFFDLVGDDRTHREVLRWLKGWDSIVFPGGSKPKTPVAKRPGLEGESDEKAHRKILLLTGPPGLGKTTLAHVCAMQAGYEIMEINASDERSSNVVKGRIRTSVGTESVKNVASSAGKSGEAQNSARPVCVVVDEVDGVVSGSGGSGEGGFIKALIDLIQLDAKNSSSLKTDQSNYGGKKKRRGDKFRLLRPLILICNDVYHPSLRPLRQSSFAEIIHIRKPPIEAVVARMKSVFEREGLGCDTDGVRKLCEATWGISSGPEARFDSSGTGEGDLRSVLVVGEWVAGKLKSSGSIKPRLTKKWVEQNMLNHLSHGGDGTRGIGRGGAKEVVSRVFLIGAGFPKPLSTMFQPLSKPAFNAAPQAKLHDAEIAKRAGMNRLREMVDTSDDIDRIVTDIFAVYPSQPFNDDSILSKPNSAYEWLQFHDSCSTRVFTEQDFELMPYLSQPVLACHDLFASPARHFQQAFDQTKRSGEDANGAEEEQDTPFSGPRADYDAREAEKAHRATILELQANLNPALLRSFRSPEDIATDLLPYLVRILSPEVKPIVVGGSGDQKGIASVRKEGERDMVRRAVNVMSGVGVKFERGRLEGDFGNRGSQWVYRMEPPLDDLVEFSTCPGLTLSNSAPVRYAVRQVLDQEHQKNIIVRENEARQRRYKSGNHRDDDSSYTISSTPQEKEKPGATVASVTDLKKDFFGREVKDREVLEEDDCNAMKMAKVERKDENKVWITFHEGYSNAVRKPITVEELMRCL